MRSEMRLRWSNAAVRPARPGAVPARDTSAMTRTSWAMDIRLRAALLTVRVAGGYAEFGVTMMKRLLVVCLLAAITGLVAAPALYAQDCPPRRGCLYPAPPETRYHAYPTYLGAPTACMMPAWSYSDGRSKYGSAAGSAACYSSGYSNNSGGCSPGTRCGFMNCGCSPAYSGISPPAYGTPTPFISARPLVVPASATLPGPAAPSAPSEK